jgi:hypothetical protein
MGEWRSEGAALRAIRLAGASGVEWVESNPDSGFGDSRIQDQGFKD